MKRKGREGEVEWWEMRGKEIGAEEKRGTETGRKDGQRRDANGGKSEG